MKKLVINITIIIAVFVISLFVIGSMINQGTTDTTMEMGEATLPLVSAQYNGMEINLMHGYRQEMQTSLMRETITPLMTDRKVMLEIDPFGMQISDLSFEVRSVNGDRLIEDTQITDWEEENDGCLRVTLELKDLLDVNQEYELILLITPDTGDTIRYYTRIISQEDYHVTDKLEFVKDFTNKTFNKESAKELTKYLESDSTGDNTTLGQVTIHSSFNQITYGDLTITEKTEPDISIKDIDEQTGCIATDFYVTTSNEGTENIYHVQEYYRVRYTSDRMYLLDYERTMDQIFQEQGDYYVNNKIMLGITSDEVQMKESDDGNILAFVSGNRLYSYNTVDNKMAYLFGFYDKDHSDARTLYDRNRIKILDVNEGGNITYLVYGYMNRGKHEGEVGVSAYFYDSTVNTIEELVYIPSDSSPDVLIEKVEKLSYINRDGILYLMDNQHIYGINSSQRSYETVVDQLHTDGYVISDSNRMIAWQEGDSLQDSQSMVLMNLNTGEQKQIKVKSSESIIPIGFIEDDLIYGIVRKADIEVDHAGDAILPMYCVKIEDENEGVLMNYEQDNVYVLSGIISGNQIILQRVTKDEEGSYQEIAEDQIVDSENTSTGRNTIEEVTTQNYEKIKQLVLRKDMEVSAMKHLTPKEVLFEGERSIYLRSDEEEQEQFYVYNKMGICGIYDSADQAVDAAEDKSGVVLNREGDYVWKKTIRSTKNQIMAIQADTVTEEKNSLAVVLDTMLSYEGVMRNSAYMLNNGESISSILESALDGCQVLDLNGCSLEAVLYYVDCDIPVLVMLDDGEALLLIGFNESNTVVMDPQTGTIYKMGMTESKEYFEENGNQFITYIRKGG